MRKFIVGGIAAAALLISGTSIAAAAPDFGPGESVKGPQDAGAKCHPPGQTLPSPECK